MRSLKTQRVAEDPRGSMKTQRGRWEHQMVAEDPRGSLKTEELAEDPKDRWKPKGSLKTQRYL